MRLAVRVFVRLKETERVVVGVWVPVGVLVIDGVTVAVGLPVEVSGVGEGLRFVCPSTTETAVINRIMTLTSKAIRIQLQRLRTHRG